MTTQRTNPFPQELWGIIFECVNPLHGFNEYRVDPAPRLSYHRWIRGIRTLSTGFNKSVRRYFWESMGTDKMIPLQKLLLGSNPLHKTMIDSIHMYTRYLAIDSPLDLDQPNLRSALQLIAGCKVLEYFSWEYPNIVYTITASVRNDLAASRDEFDRLSRIVSKCCHDFVNQGVALKSYDFEFQSSTERLVMRRRFAKPKHPISSNNSGTSTSKALDKVKVTKEGRRESPQLHLGPRGTEFPRTRKLKLVNCSWGRLEEVPMTWDFKNVRCLSIKNIDLRFFLEGVSLPDLSQLQTFKARQTIVCHSVDPANRKLLEGLIKSCQHLQNLKIECQHFMELIPWDVIRLFGSRLRKLTLLDCFTDQFPRLFYMKSILQNCPNIEDLGIGFFVHTQERDQLVEYLEMLVRTGENLRSLTFWEDNLSNKPSLEIGSHQHVLPRHHYRSRARYIDPNFVRARRIMEKLHRMKQDSNFRVTIHLGNSSHPLCKCKHMNKFEESTGWRTFHSGCSSAGAYEQWGSNGTEAMVEFLSADRQNDLLCGCQL